MNPEEYDSLARIEKNHWFYRGKRRLVRQWLLRLFPNPKGKLLLDCGCGTGIFASEMQSLFNVVAVDDHQEALVLARKKLGPDICREGTALSIPMADNSTDVVTLLDVLEHIPLDQPALQEILRVLKPGGYLIISVPAFQSLWGDWDVSLHHYRRYTARELAMKICEVGYQLDHWNYLNVLILPFVFLIRQWRNLFGSSRSKKKRIEDFIPPSWINNALEWQYVTLGFQQLIRFPFGVSILAIARKP